MMEIIFFFTEITGVTAVVLLHCSDGARIPLLSNCCRGGLTKSSTRIFPIIKFQIIANEYLKI
jgi:hypothetical protein